MAAANRSTYWMATACVAALAASVLFPRFVPDTGGGFAAATSAAVLFVGLAAVAAIASLALLLRTLTQRAALSLPAQIAGTIPAVLVAIGLLATWLSMRSDT